VKVSAPRSPFLLMKRMGDVNNEDNNNN